MNKTCGECKDCKWWENIPDNDEEGQLRDGLCRVHSAQINKNGLGWPQTDEFDWCGEFESKSEEESEILKKPIEYLELSTRTEKALVDCRFWM